MDIFEKLVQSSKDVLELEKYLEVNLDELYDCLLSQDYNKVNNYKSHIEAYILSNYKVFRVLDQSKDSTFVFYNILLNACERFGFLSSFLRLYKLLSKSDYLIGSRLEAASLYLIGIKTANDYLARYPEIFKKLTEAFNYEEDNVDGILATTINYYSHLVRNFGDANIDVVNGLKLLMEQSIADDEQSFLNHPLVFEVLNTDLTLPQYAYIIIQNSLDTFLGRNKTELFLENKLLLESGTEYCDLLEGCDANFNSLRQLAIDQYHLIPNSKKYFDGLKRGVKVLTEVEELYAYMVGFGLMHRDKLLSAYSFLPDDLFNKQLNIIDWGCGQGLATLTFLQYAKEQDYNLKINSFQLIEPSEIALKRASLHISKFIEGVETATIMKDFDSLEENDFDFYKLKAQIHLHLFSNILDIDLFSLSRLISLIKNTFTGQNYFICVSPYVNDLKTNRLDRFVKSFKFEKEFEIIKEINNKKGDWTINNNWTRVLREFKVTLG